jgi:hypothetical protein
LSSHFFKSIFQRPRRGQKPCAIRISVP